MIAAWMIYSVAVTFFLYAATLGADYVVRALRAPTRFVWLLAVAVAVALSGRALLRRSDTSPPAPAAPSGARSISSTSQAPTAGREAALPSAAIETSVARLRTIERSVGGSVSRIDVSILDRWNGVLLIAWAATSALMLCWLLVSLVRLRRLARRLDSGNVSHQEVLLSDDVGPALLGILAARIVLPRWVLELPAAEQETIVAHERQHAVAFDPALVCASICIVAIEPWNVVLWMLLSRLRLAVEADCDRRVLGQAGDARAYGKLLVAMYEKTSGLSPHVAFAERSSNLERRIRRITSRPRLFSTAVGGSAIAAVVLATAAWKTSVPTRTAPLPSPTATLPKPYASVADHVAQVLSAQPHEDHQAPAQRIDPISGLPEHAPATAVVAETSSIRVTIESPNHAPYRLAALLPDTATPTSLLPSVLRGTGIINWAFLSSPTDMSSRMLEITSLDDTSQIHVQASQNGRVIASGEGSYLILRRDSVGLAIEAWSHVPPSSQVPRLHVPGKVMGPGMTIDAETAAVVHNEKRRADMPAGACATPDSVAIRGLSRLRDADVRAALGVTPKSTITGAVVTEALKNLYATNGFEANATTNCEIIGGKSVLVFNVTERGISVDSDLVRVGYVQRKQTVTGFFADSSDIDRQSPLFGDAVRILPGLRVSQGTSGRMNEITIAYPVQWEKGGCATTFLDGVRFQPSVGEDRVTVTQLIAIELYQPSNTPAQFVRRDEPNCATLVLWTEALRHRRR